MQKKVPVSYSEWVTTSLIPSGFMGLRIAFHAGRQAERARLQPLIEAARALVESWGDSQKDLAGDSEIETALRAALLAVGEELGQ